MKKMIAVALLAVAATCCGEEFPPLSLAGFAIGEKIDLKDAAVRKARGIESWSICWRVGHTNCFFNADVHSRDGYEEILVTIETGTVVSVSATVPCKTKEEGIKKSDEILAAYLKELDKRICKPEEGNDDARYDLYVGKPDLECATSGPDVEIIISAKYHSDIIHSLNTPPPPSPIPIKRIKPPLRK